MNKVLRSRIFIFILGMFVMAGIGYSVYALNASQIEYNNTNVESALDNIYSNLNSKILLSTFGTPKYAVSGGDQVSSRTVTLNNLAKGKYLIVKTISSAYASTANPDEISAELSLGGTGLLVCASSNCTSRVIGGYESRKQASTPITGSYKENNYVAYSLIYVEIKENTDSISYTMSDATNNKAVRTIGLGAIPINE